MKRKIFLTLVLVTMFFIGSNNVDALSCKVGESGCTKNAIEQELNAEGKELACLYEVETNVGTYYNYIYYDRKSTDQKNFHADSFRSIYGTLSTHPEDASNSFARGNLDKVINDYKNLNENKCPKNSYLLIHSNYLTPFACFDNNEECKSFNEEFVTVYENSSSRLIENNLDKIIFKGSDTYMPYLKKDGYCVYTNGTLTDFSYLVYSIDNKKVMFYNAIEEVSRYKISLGFFGNEVSFRDHLIKYSFQNKISNVNSCPSSIYFASNGKNFSSSYYFTDIFDSNATIVRTFDLYVPKDNDINIDEDNVGCEIFSDSLRKIINEVMSYIRIGVPLLLIVLLGVDFMKASFSGDEKAISKSKSNAIKRIIIAVIIFFVPTILNLLFNVANSVWKNAHYEICVLNDNNN